MKKIIFTVLLISALSIVIPMSANAAQAIDFSIRFFDKRIYYAENDPVYVHITISNNSPASYRFKLADERVFSMDFDIRTVSNRPLEAADALIRKRTQYQQVFFREICVEPGESFSFVEDLRDYVNLKQPGSFTVQARVYPELYRSVLINQRSANNTASNGENQNIGPAESAVLPLVSNRLNLNIRPLVIYGTDGTPVEMDIATGAALVREKIPPDQVVEYHLTAWQKSQWEKFFLYLDLESLFTEDSNRKRQWLAESEVGRRQMLAKYRQDLQNAYANQTISPVPFEFSIESTNYNKTSGTVIVTGKFRDGQVTEIKQYTYDLIQKDGIWTVVKYTVINTERE